VSKFDVTGWVLSAFGMALWLYGYFRIGHKALFDWHAFTPWWIADFLPNIEAELGIVLMLAGTVASYWPKPIDIQK
jgi:hypothetical protein